MPRFSWPTSQAWRVLRLAVVATTVVAAAARGADTKGSSMSYGESRDFLSKHTKLVELTAGDGARVAVAPAWQGRVMTSTCAGLDGPSFGFICYDFISAGKLNPHFNNYGGEDRMWLSPEGGQYSLWFKPGEAQNLANWHTAPLLNDTPWAVTSAGDPSHVRMEAASSLQNASGAKFRLHIARDVRLLSGGDAARRFGETLAEKLHAPGVKSVAYETVNQVTNRGTPMSKAKGLVAIWILGMLNSGPEAVTILPYKPGSEAELGPIVRSDYFGSVPPERLKILPQAVLFRGDANFRSKLGISQRRAKNVLGAIDFQSGVLTLVTFSMPTDPTQHLYPNSAWQMPQKEPYRGDVVNAYNDGPNETGGQMGKFFELESVSPAKELKTGESLSHRSTILHVQADRDTLAALAEAVLGVALDAVREQMLGK
jgi:hypothetical protein